MSVSDRPYVTILGVMETIWCESHNDIKTAVHSYISLLTNSTGEISQQIDKPDKIQMLTSAKTIVPWLFYPHKS